MANEEQLKILKTGVEPWNTWRRASLTKNIDLSGANLIGAYLSIADFSGADLSGADLSGVNLSSANLTRANLSGANLLGANLARADLARANLLGANLSGTNLSGANLSRTNLVGANLSGTNLSRADLARANLLGANLLGANLSRADLSRANLLGTDLPNADLSRANLLNTNLMHTNLTSSILTGANLSDANLSGAKLPERMEAPVTKEIKEDDNIVEPGQKEPPHLRAHPKDRIISPSQILTPTVRLRHETSERELKDLRDLLERCAPGIEKFDEKENVLRVPMDQETLNLLQSIVKTAIELHKAQSYPEGLVDALVGLGVALRFFKSSTDWAPLPKALKDKIDSAVDAYDGFLTELGLI